MKDNIQTRSGRLMFLCIQFTLAGYGVFRTVDAFLSGHEGSVMIAFITLCTVFFLMGLISLFNYLQITESFFIPLVIFLANTVASFLMGSFGYFFVIHIGIFCISALYFDPRRFLTFLIISQIISFVLVIFRLPLMNPMRALPPFSEVVTHWFITFMGSVFIYILVWFASKRNDAAVRAEHSFNALLEGTHDWVVFLDSLNRVTFLSKPMFARAGLEEAQFARGRPIFDLFPDINTKELFYDIVQQGDSYEGTRDVEIGGEIFYFGIITFKLPAPTQGRIIQITDITPVMKAKFEAEAASQSKSSFLATMSHEIRTPLNAIIGLSEIELQKKLPDESRRTLEKIHNSGGSLLGIINDILDISKIEAGGFDLVPVEYEVPSMVNDTIQLNIIRIGSKRLVFKLEIDDTLPTKLYGDELRVRQVLNNLLSNAFKYTDEGTVSFSIAWEQKGETAWLTFTVQDTGHGIRKENLNRLFSEYSQLDARANRHIEGTGLGLSITKKLVDLMHGSISVESEYGKGSTFTIQIPQRIMDRDPIGEITARNLEHLRFKETRQNRGLRLMRSYMPYGRVLVVDDVETNLDVARGLLVPYGLDVDAAASGAEAIDKIRAVEKTNARYNLVLMDHMMPGMDGIEAVRIIRNEIGTDYARTVPIIALTANALAGNELMFLSRGFNAYISKPVDIMQLDVALNTWVKNKQSKETLLQAEMEYAIRAKEDVNIPSVLDGFYVEGLDLVLGRERYGSEDAYLTILRSYVVHTPPLLEKLRTLFPVQLETARPISLADYTVMIHGLKGSSYGICANAVGKAAENLETAAKAGDLERILADNGPFIEMVELLLMDMGELLKKAADSRGEKRKASAPDPVLLNKFLESSKRYKSTLMEEALVELESFEYESGGDLVVWLREQLDNLEYDAIRERLESQKVIRSEQ